MAVALTGILSDLSSAIPSSSDILQQVMIGAAATTVLAGIKTQQGQDAIDPLHIFHKDTVTPTNNPNNIVGPTVTSSAFAAMPPASQQMLLSNGVHVVAG
jgi:hypothetical protein